MRSRTSDELQFYPTPEPLIQKMIDGFGVRPLNGFLTEVGLILEPSAGTGVILDYLIGLCGGYQKDRVKSQSYAIEIDLERRLILQGKGYKVIDSDFLAYNEPTTFDLVLANPPFRNGAAHFLKAWDVLSIGGKMCLILNASTVRDAVTADEQRVRHIVERFGRVEYMAEQFVEADRPTRVEIAVVWIEKPKTHSVIDDIEDVIDLESDATAEDEFNPNELANRDSIQALVDRYEAARAALTEEYEARKRKRHYTKILGSDQPDDKKASLAEELIELKSAFWKHLFRKTRIGVVTTTAYQEKFHKLTQTTGSLAFSMHNIMEIVGSFVQNQNAIMEECILDTFDLCTRHHYGNRENIEGWKTNKGWKIPQKFILPYCVTNAFGWSIDYKHGRFLDDLDRIMCLLSGQDIEKITRISESISSRCSALNQQRYQRVTAESEIISYTDEIESTFFRAKMFKKGTVHLVAKEPELWNEFNRRAAQGKKWIGYDAGKKVKP